MSSHHTPWKILGMAFILAVIGAVGFAHLETMSLTEGFYQSSLILLTHFSHTEFHSPAGRVLNILLIISSFALIGYLLKWFAEYMIGISDNVRKRRLQAKIKKLNDHYIVCGLGRVGSHVAREMAMEGIQFVAIDQDQSKVDQAVADGWIAFKADSASEEVLKDAGVERAAAVVAGLGDDSANLLVTLGARALNSDIYIVARANRAENEAKLKHAGADRVAMPYQIGGYHMASMALRPSVVDYMDVVSQSGGTTDLQVEEMVVADHSKLSGHRLGKALADGSIGATVIAINGKDGVSKVRPTGHEVIYPGDRLIILGAKADLTKASELTR